VLRKLSLVFAIVVAIGAAVSSRVLINGDAELAASTAALALGDPREAVVAARRAAGWYLPGAPHVAAAYQRLLALARTAEQHRQGDIALAAWRGVRSAALESRWLYTPHRAELDEANREIARLMAKVPNAAQPDASIQQAALQKLLRHEVPNPWWALGLLGGALLTATGFASWATAAGDVAGRLAWARARAGAAMALSGIVLWLLALWRA
jgi:hypothetical protein